MYIHLQQVNNLSIRRIKPSDNLHPFPAQSSIVSIAPTQKLVHCPGVWLQLRRDAITSTHELSVS